MPIIELPDGHNAEFPDDMPMDQIKAVIQKKYPPQSSQAGQGAISMPANLAGLAMSGMENPGQAALNRLKGLGQGVQNVATGYANLLPGVNIPKGHWAGDSADAKMTENLVDFGSYFLPGKALGTAGKFAGKIEEIANALKKVAPTLKKVPGLNAVSKIGRGAGEGAIASAALADKDQQGEAAETGALWGAGGNALGHFMGSENPIVSAIARMATGGAVGAGADYVTGRGHPLQSALTGAGIGLVAPRGVNALVNKMPPGMETLEHINPLEVAPVLEAANRLGTRLKPGEASANPFVEGQEGRYAATGESAALDSKLQKERFAEQKKAIDQFKSQISPGTQDASHAIRGAAQDYLEEVRGLRQKAADPYYKAAEKDRVSPGKLSKMEAEDPNISKAIDDVMSDPKYQVKGELLGEPRTSIKVLDYAKRRLGSLIEENKGTIARPGDRDSVRIYTKSQNKLLDAMDEFSENHKKARQIFADMSPHLTDAEQSQLGRLSELKDTQLKNASSMIFDPSQTNLRVLSKIKQSVMRRNPQAWDGIVRNEIERLTKKGVQNGSEFFRNVLSNDSQFKQFDLALDHNPEAQQALRDMKTAWKRLQGEEKGGRFRAKSGIDQSRGWTENILDAWNRVTGAKRNVAAIKFINSGEWEKGFSKIAEIKDKEKRIAALGRMLAQLTAKGGAAAGVVASQAGDEEQ